MENFIFCAVIIPCNKLYMKTTVDVIQLNPHLRKSNFNVKLGN